MQQDALCTTSSGLSLFSCGSNRGEYRWRSISRGIDISLFDNLHFREYLTLSFVKPAIISQPVLSGE